MKEYYFETHAHTMEVSSCGKVKASQLAEAYKKAGYSGVVVTDHFSRHSFAHIKNPTHEEMVDYFLTGYRKVKKEADEQFTVLLGMELTFYENANDYLVYGIDENFLYQHKGLLSMGIEKFSELAKEKGLLLFQAHPFRNDMTVTRPELLYGVEVYNGNQRHDSRNEIAEAWAEKFDLHIVGGSDFHQPEDVGTGGIITDFQITDYANFLSVLRKRPRIKKG